MQVFRPARVSPRVDAVELARETNARTYEVGIRFSGSEPPDETVTAFLCECGCFTYVALPLTRYADSGAWIDEHRDAIA